MAPSSPSLESDPGKGAGDGVVSARAGVAGRAGPEGVSGGGRGRYGADTRIVAVAGLSCPCGGTHVRSTRELEGVRVTKVKAKKATLRVSYSLISARA